LEERVLSSLQVEPLAVPGPPEPSAAVSAALARLEKEFQSLAEEQAELTATLETVSRSLVAERMRNMTLVMAVVAIGLANLAVWLFFRAPGG
jgi:hypothetical protein